MSDDDDREEIEALEVRLMSRLEVDGGATVREARILSRPSDTIAHQMMAVRVVIDSPQWRSPTTRVLLVSKRRGQAPRCISVRMPEVGALLDGLEEADRLGHARARDGAT